MKQLFQVTLIKKDVSDSMSFDN